MAVQPAELRLAQACRSPSDSATSGTTVPVLVATCLLAALVGLGLLGQRQPGPGGARVGADDNGAWVVGP
ncbi:MAG: hypothetical protein J2P54_25045 [Bradyrhizobiaceae bacterium]|nr:hypothetical protein [Bradyrhizobiaceae bacterium]